MSSVDLVPMEFNVIVELDPTQEKTSGGILLPGQKVERNRLEEVEGTLVAMSPLAGSEIWQDGHRPQLGDRVFFARYAGILTERDGKWVRVVKDKEIVAVVRQPTQLKEAA
jgi:co-chaperonin GroES (HSP10)